MSALWNTNAIVIQLYVLYMYIILKYTYIYIYLFHLKKKKKNRAVVNKFAPRAATAYENSININKIIIKKKTKS